MVGKFGSNVELEERVGTCEYHTYQDVCASP